jgi:hypothetical protein
MKSVNKIICEAFKHLKLNACLNSSNKCMLDPTKQLMRKISLAKGENACF